MRRAWLLVLASTVSMVGWGTVLPYQYAYAATTRGWGTAVAASASSLFSVGALVAAPVGGRLADRFDPSRVAVVAKAMAALATASLAFAQTPTWFLLAMTAFGVGVTAAAPAQSVLALSFSTGDNRRKVFAWQFTGQALGMALGAFAAGQLVDLGRPDGMEPAFVLATAGFVAAAALLAAAGRGAALASSRVEPAEQVRSLVALRAIWATPALRWTAVVTAALALGFYAQFEAGLPAYAITVLGVDERAVGTVAAVNCLVIVALQLVVVRLTARRDAATLLVAVGVIWVLAWTVLAVASWVPEVAAALFVTTFAVFAVGETMYAPVLNPLTAALAPAGMVGSTLGAFAAVQTGVSAAGPLLAGLALSAGRGSVFVVAHLLVSAAAVYAAWRLRAALRRPAGRSPRPVQPGGTATTAGLASGARAR